MAADPRGTHEIGLDQMEIHVHHGREKLTNNLELIVDRIQRTAMTEYHGGLNMEHREESRDESAPHSRRAEKGTGGPK